MKVVTFRTHEEVIRMRNIIDKQNNFISAGTLAGFQPCPALCRVRPLARHLPGGDVEAIEDVDRGDSNDQGGKSPLVVVAVACSQISSGTGSARSLSRVTASVSASAARSASVK